MSLDLVAPLPTLAMPGPQTIGQYSPWPVPPVPGQPVPAEAHWALTLNPDTGAAVFQSNTPVQVRVFTAAYTTSREQGPDRITSWMPQGETREPTGSAVLPVNYEAYLDLAQRRSDVWGVMAFAVLFAPDGELVASGDPNAVPSDDLLRIFVTLTDLQGLFE